MPAPIMGDDAISFVEEEHHLVVPIVTTQGPAVMEDDRLGLFGSPVLVEDVGAVGRGDEGHVCHPCQVLPASGAGAGLAKPKKAGSYGSVNARNRSRRWARRIRIPVTAK